MGKSNATVRIEVFRPGTFTPMQGQSITYTAADLKAAADVYDKETAPAPVVVGHPSTDAPAYAWATGFEYDAATQRLYADVGDINPAFAEAVRKGSYRKVSMSFHRPDSSANPVPGTWYPKHIGFLGGAAPAVTGLRNVQFGTDAAFVTFTADVTFAPDFALENKAPSPVFGDREAVFAAREAEFATREAEWKKRERDFANKENCDFAEKLISEGRLLPSQKDRVVSMLNTAITGDAVSFAEGEQPVPMVQALRDLLSQQPKVVSFGAFDMGRDSLDTPHPSINVPDGYMVDPRQQELYNRVRQIQQEKNFSFEEALSFATGK
ncbi:hypothetical protein [Brucella inopinata]|uniref:hypothetical protein n=1 Tax=Brucella inopinata TaxID=1218315 RepID=UPI00031A75DB|nr:hypothetical protein [Brucella inopinata]